MLEIAAESRRGHANQVGQLFQADIILIMLVDEVLDLQHTAALTLQIDLRVG